MNLNHVILIPLAVCLTVVVLGCMILFFYRHRIINQLLIPIYGKLAVKAKLTEELEVLLDQVVKVPIELELDLPIHTKIRVKDTIHTKISVPIEINIDQETMDLSQMTVVVDDDFLIHDTVRVESKIEVSGTAKTFAGFTVPVDMSLPIEMEVPIKQKVHVFKKMKVQTDGFSIPFKKVIDMNLSVPIDQEILVEDIIPVRINEQIDVPIQQILKVVPTGELLIRVDQITYG